MNTALLAFRNLRRQRLRTGMRIAGLAATTAVMIVWGVLNRGFIASLRESAVAHETGEFQIHHRSWPASQSPYETVSAGLLARIRTTGFAASGRLYSSALGAADSRSAGIKVIGIDPDAELEVTTLEQHLSDGTWLSEDLPQEVVVGKALARQLQLRPGAEIVILGQANDGSIASGIYHVRGILKTVTRDTDNRAVFMNTGPWRELFQMPEGFHEIALRVPGGMSDESTRTSLLGLTGPESQVLVRSWREIKPLLARMLDLLLVTVTFTLSFTYLALGGMILNTVFMTVHNRLREYGIMKACGISPVGLVGMILAEWLWLAFFGGVLALAVGLPVAFWLQKNGLDFSGMMGRMAFAGVHMEPVLYAKVSFWPVALPLIFLLVVLPLSAMYPSIEAARLLPREALNRQ